jgi:hypothetical protein
MEDRAPRQGLGRLLLKALAIMSALAFLAIVMVNACAHYLAPTKAAPVVSPREPVAAPPASTNGPPAGDATEEGPMNRLPPSRPETDPMVAPATKSGAVVRPRPLLAPATKSGAVVRPRPLMNLPPEETPPKNGAPQQQAAPQPRGSR